MANKFDYITSAMSNTQRYSSLPKVDADDYFFINLVAGKSCLDQLSDRERDRTANSSLMKYVNAIVLQHEIPSRIA